MTNESETLPEIETPIEKPLPEIDQELPVFLRLPIKHLELVQNFLKEQGLEAEAHEIKEFTLHYTDPKRNAYRLEYLKRARALARDGEVEFDDDSIVSGSEQNGEYMLAWVWVDGPEEDLDEMSEEEETESLIIEDAYNCVMSQMEDAVTEACTQAGYPEACVYYSAYTSDDKDVPINNLYDRAVEGYAIFVYKGYSSGVVHDATWLQLAVLANAAIQFTGDEHHCFFEGVESCNLPGFRKDDGIPVYRLVMGS
jgi:hypothetical protein